MKIELKSNHIPVLGWCDVSECSCYKQFAEEVRDGEIIIYNSAIELDNGELCAFIFYDDYPKKTLYAVFSGTVEYLGRYPDHSAPYTYAFYPEKEIEISCIGYDKEGDDPQVLIMKSKKL